MKPPIHIKIVRDPETSCARKVRHSTLEYAEKVREKMEAKGSRGLEAYHCEFCDGWHLGHGSPVISLFTRLQRLFGGKS